MPYRLYNKDVAEGFVDFDDEKYYILHERVIDGTTIAVIFDQGRFIVAYGLGYEVYNSIHWVQGYYFDDLLTAVDKFKSYKERTDGERKHCVIKSKEDDEVLFILEVKNYDRDFELSLREVRDKYYESDNGSLLDDFVLEALEEAGYEYEFTGFEEFNV